MMKTKERLQQKLQLRPGAIIREKVDVIDVNRVNEQCNSANAAGLYDKGVKYGLEALDLATKLGVSKNQLAPIWWNLSISYEFIDPKEAIKYIKKAEPYFKDKKDQEDLLESKFRCYVKIYDFDNAVNVASDLGCDKGKLLIMQLKLNAQIISPQQLLSQLNDIKPSQDNLILKIGLMGLAEARLGNISGVIRCIKAISKINPEHNEGMSLEIISTFLTRACRQIKVATSGELL